MIPRGPGALVLRACLLPVAIHFFALPCLKKPPSVAARFPVGSVWLVWVQAASLDGSPPPRSR